MAVEKIEFSRLIWSFGCKDPNQNLLIESSANFLRKFLVVSLLQVINRVVTAKKNKMKMDLNLFYQLF